MFRNSNTRWYSRKEKQNIRNIDGNCIKYFVISFQGHLRKFSSLTLNLLSTRENARLDNNNRHTIIRQQTKRKEMLRATAKRRPYRHSTKFLRKTMRNFYIVVDEIRNNFLINFLLARTSGGKQTNKNLKRNRNRSLENSIRIMCNIRNIMRCSKRADEITSVVRSLVKNLNASNFYRNSDQSVVKRHETLAAATAATPVNKNQTTQQTRMPSVITLNTNYAAMRSTMSISEKPEITSIMGSTITAARTATICRSIILTIIMSIARASSNAAITATTKPTVAVRPSTQVPVPVTMRMLKCDNSSPQRNFGPRHLQQSPDDSNGAMICRRLLEYSCQFYSLLTCLHFCTEVSPIYFISILYTLLSYLI